MLPTFTGVPTFCKMYLILSTFNDVPNFGICLLFLLLQTPKEHCPSTLECIVKGVRQATSDGRTSYVESGNFRTSYKISLFKVLDTIDCTKIFMRSD